MWQLNCMLNTAKWLLPFQGHLRTAKHFLSPPTLSHAHELVFAGAFEHLSALEHLGFDIRNKSVLEIGSGWFPILPMILRIAGARQIYITDMHRLLDHKNLMAARNFLLERTTEISERLMLPFDHVERALTYPSCLDLEDALEWLNFHYIVPFKTEQYNQITGLDLVVSHTVLEHVPHTIILQMFDNIKSMLNPGGMMIHGIDHTDHRAHRDRNLSTFDFLRYSDPVWHVLCLNPQDYTNRLRHSDYIEMMRECGYEIMYSHTFVNNALINEVRRVPLWGRFRNMEPEDLATSWSQIVAQPAPESP